MCAAGAGSVLASRPSGRTAVRTALRMNRRTRSARAAERPECAICAPAGGARPALNTLVQPGGEAPSALPTAA
jgi:hypothetical protein